MTVRRGIVVTNQILNGIKKTKVHRTEQLINNDNYEISRLEYFAKDATIFTRQVVFKED